ncbi:MAG: DUF1156 domain-containing protein, partial [Deltaproteobacteria bacterium]|nr:DUF1156 domain-containing protein [Deltaproteobacteria bacterium]
ELAPFYPTYADFEPIDLKHPNPYEKQPMRLVPSKDDGTPNIDALNGEFSKEYLADKRNPRWVAKPTVAYLWARTVKCKNCRADIPLLKTLWLHRKGQKRVLLKMRTSSDKSSVDFEIENKAPKKGGNAAQRREHDRILGLGTMSQSGVTCPCCNTINILEDIQLEGKAKRLGAILTAVVVQGRSKKEYRLPDRAEIDAFLDSVAREDGLFRDIPLGLPDETISPDRPSPNTRGASGLPRYGFITWSDLFTPRQKQSLNLLLSATRAASKRLMNTYVMPEWQEVLAAYLMIVFDKFLTNSSQLCSWNANTGSVRHTFSRFALPMVWDYVEVCPFSESSGGYAKGLHWIGEVTTFLLQSMVHASNARVINGTAKRISNDTKYDCIITDPPYYDAIPYSDIMDFYHVWIRRGFAQLGHSVEWAFSSALGPKWDAEQNDGELIDQPSRFYNNLKESKMAYEDGMSIVLKGCEASLVDDGRLVVVFANKQPAAWETLASSLIRAGFVVDATWPIQTERSSRTNALEAATLSSSVWLVCKKRPITARPGWDNKVLEEMRANVTDRLRDYWDAGIRGPDFVWAATGPALEAYSKHPIVKKANTPGEVMSVGEFLSHVRRMVVDFVVGQVLTGEKEGTDMAAADRMDAPTAYYLLHRHDFGIDGAPAGACILYATACGLSDRDLESAWDLVSHKGSATMKIDEDEASDPDAEAEPEGNGGSGSKIKLKTWAQRKRRTMGYEAPSGRPIPLIDRVHCLMHLWRAGDVHKVDEYLDDNG